MENNHRPQQSVGHLRYDSLSEAPDCSNFSDLLDLEILGKKSSHDSTADHVIVSIKCRVPSIQTLFVAEKNDNTNIYGVNCGRDPSQSGKFDNIPYRINRLETSGAFETKGLCIKQLPTKWSGHNGTDISPEMCHSYDQQPLEMNYPKQDSKIDKPRPLKIDKATLIITNSSSDESLLGQPSRIVIDQLQTRIDQLERRVIKQEILIRTMNPRVSSSSEEECGAGVGHEHSKDERPGCSYVQQYNHVPETSAFQRIAQRGPPLPESDGVSIDKEHKSEQYGRDFTTYDGLTTKSRRKTVSAPFRRNEPNAAAERAHKIRHKLTPVKDYKLMDTVHYLAQGEFAPRDDGIKLTPSREAVLSDIIWEDVCRTHWPNTRLSSRRGTRTDRHSPRLDLQRLVDNLLRERVIHAERRRRRHYRVERLNQRQERKVDNVGKTRHIIVASNKTRRSEDQARVAGSDHGATTATSDKHCSERPRKGHRSQEHMLPQEVRHQRQFNPEDCCPGPSGITRFSETPTYASPSSVDRWEPSNSAPGKSHLKNPRLVVKKVTSRGKNQSIDGTEHFIVLPTLVVRSPSNVRRQKNFNELYHRVLSFNTLSMQDDLHDHQCTPEIEPIMHPANPQLNNSTPRKKDIGLNINITLSDSEENL